MTAHSFGMAPVMELHDSLLLLPNAVEHLADNEGTFPYAFYAKSRQLDDGFHVLTYRELGSAIDNVAHHLRERLGNRPSPSKVIAYLGPNTPYTTVALVAAMKAGFELFLPSERNSAPAQLHLFHAVSCTTLITPDLTFPAVQAITSASPTIELIQLPLLSDVLSPPTRAFAFTKTVSEIRDQTSFIVHTSGSTGFPKPVRISFEAVMRMSRCLTLPEVPGHRTMTSMLRGKRCINLLPLNHPAGINIGIMNAIWNRYTIVLPPPGLPPTALTLSSLTDRIDVDWAAVAPLTIQELSKDLVLAERVTGKLSMLLYSGGSCPKVFGDTISSKVMLLNSPGSSETGPLPTIYPDDFDWSADWEYLRLHPAINASFDPLPDGTFELIQQRSAESEPFQVAFMLPGSKNVFRTRDIFVPHPAKDGLWAHSLRSDDVIVLLNGEKVDPVRCESIVASNPKVAGALMFGAQRFEVGLLVELSGNSNMNLSSTQKAAILEDIWPKVKEANVLLPQHGQIDKAHILFTSPDEPILRTLKNTVRRKATLDSYTRQIEKLYADIEEMRAPTQAARVLSLDDCKHAILQGTHGERRLAALKDTDDFFEHGMDSLQVLRLIRHVKVATGIDVIDPSMVYQSPSIESLAATVFAQSKAHFEETLMSAEHRDVQMRALVQKFTHMLEPLRGRAGTGGVSTNEKHVVILTGSTGSIGRYVLRSLLKRADVAHIYCLNRVVDAAAVQRQRNSSTDPTLPTVFDPARVTFLQAELSKENLGLKTSPFHKLLAEVTSIIHAAWPVDFNRPLSSFEPSLHGLTNLIALCGKSLNKARLMFVSSISATMNGKGEITEAVISKSSVCPGAGYAESKWIGEMICQYATDELRIPITIARLGQIAGAVNSPGAWNVADWPAALIISSAYLGVIPDRLTEGVGYRKDIRWMPVDVIAEVLVEYLEDQSNEILQVYQPLNPKAVSWFALLESVVFLIDDLQDGQNKGKGVEIVPAARWVRRLRESGTDAGKDLDELLRLNPALKLERFFEQQYNADQRLGEGKDKMARSWSSHRALRSKTLQGTQAIKGEDLQRWITGWFEQIKLKT